MPVPKKQEPPSAEPWEVEYVHQELPTHSRDEIERVAGECKKEIPDSKNRKKVLKCVQRKFS